MEIFEYVNICEDLIRSAEISEDLLRSHKICKDLLRSVEMCKDLTKSAKICQNMQALNTLILFEITLTFVLLLDISAPLNALEKEWQMAMEMFLSEKAARE